MRMFFLIFLTSCSFLTKKEVEVERFKVNQCLFSPGVRAMIIDVSYNRYRLFYKIDRSMYLADEPMGFVHQKMIPVKCTPEIIQAMEKFIKESYSTSGF